MVSQRSTVKTTIHTESVGVLKLSTHYICLLLTDPASSAAPNILQIYLDGNVHLSSFPNPRTKEDECLSSSMLVLTLAIVAK